MTSIAALLLSTLCLVVPLSAALASSRASSLCPDENGAFVGLAADPTAYSSVPGVALNASFVAQEWKLVDESTIGPRNSLTGSYLQVLPDARRTYPSRGVVLTDPAQLEGNAPYVAFRLRVEKDKKGWHTLFLRWTGGDTVGGGDSMFVTMYNPGSKLVTGQRTLRPTFVPVSTTIRTIAGCCYNSKTHACPCVNDDSQDQHNNETCPNFLPREQAASFGIQCPLGPGVMEFVNAPRWYLYAGQDVGNVMDFEAEPWDATCEAEGSNTKDSGAAFASWYLNPGTHELRIYAREDGTALDAIYVAGPQTPAPAFLRHYNVGDSTVCRSRIGSSSWKGFWNILLVGGVTLGCLYIALTKSEQARDWVQDRVRDWRRSRGAGGPDAHPTYHELVLEQSS